MCWGPHEVSAIPVIARVRIIAIVISIHFIVDYTVLSVLAVHQPFYISISISTLPIYIYIT